MGKLLATRAAQYPLVAEFVFQHNQWVIDSADTTKKTLGSTVALSTDPSEPALTGPVANTITFDAIPLPYGAVICGGEVINEVAYTGCTAATLKVGIAGTLEAYQASANVNLMSAANTRVALLLTSSLASKAGANVRLTIGYTVANATAGKTRVRIMYTIEDKASENTIN